MVITRCETPADLEAARRLFRAYAASLPFSLDYQGFAAELAELPGPYAMPAGCLLLAASKGAQVGIVGLKPLEPGVAEIKRLYVAPEARGRWLGKALAERALAEACAKGYKCVRLDTHRPSMPAAIALYRSLGFTEIKPYGPDLGGEIAFFEKEIVTGGSATTIPYDGLSAAKPITTRSGELMGFAVLNPSYIAASTQAVKSLSAGPLALGSRWPAACHRCSPAR